MTWKENLPNINKFFSSFFPSTSPAIRMPKRVHGGDSLTMKLPPDFHRIKQACEFLPLIYHFSTKWIDFRLQNLTNLQKEKKNIVREVFARSCSAKKLS